MGSAYSGTNPNASWCRCFQDDLHAYLDILRGIGFRCSINVTDELRICYIGLLHKGRLLQRAYLRM